MTLDSERPVWQSITILLLDVSLTLMFHWSSSKPGLRFPRRMFGGIKPFSIAIMVFMRPAEPLAASECPRLGFAVPTKSGFLLSRPSQKTFLIAPTEEDISG
jgi:hypothetical protein